MSRHRIVHRIAALASFGALASLAACASSPSASRASVDPSTTLLVRLGSDTLAMEQYTRTPTRMEGLVVSRTPVAQLQRYTVDIGADNAPVRVEYSTRRADGTAPATNAVTGLTIRFVGDSLLLTGRRASGDTSRATVARGMLLPYVNNSYGLYEYAIARLRAAGRDSAEFALVPMNIGVRTLSPLPMRIRGDTVRITWFGSPLLARQDADGRLLGLDGSRTTVKVRVDRVASTDLVAIADRWAARERTAGQAGPASTRDTVTATVGAARLWVDYGRPALRGRNPWGNGVLGDTIWRTGANAATQFRTNVDLVVAGATVPAGTYTLWTVYTPRGWRLAINKQVGQWGTEYHADRDLVRVPLRESTVGAPVERFTIGVSPAGGGSAASLDLTWGTKRLSASVTPK